MDETEGKGKMAVNTRDTTVRNINKTTAQGQIMGKNDARRTKTVIERKQEINIGDTIVRDTVRRVNRTTDVRNIVTERRTDTVEGTTHHHHMTE